MAVSSKVAIVTGSSRGIGKGCALHLARAGFDVVICARTIREGQAFEHSSNVGKSDTTPLPGSLEETAAEIEALGRKALAVKLDLNERRDIENVVQQAMERFGRVDVLVNNARYIGPGIMDPFLDVPIDVSETEMRCNVLAPLYFCKLVVPIMIEQGGGMIINISAAAVWRETASMPGAGGWGIGYSMTKAAMARLAPGLAKELKRHNIAVINLAPGYVQGERHLLETRVRTTGYSQGLTPEVPGAACAFLATHPYPLFYSGKMINAPELVVDHDLLDGAKFPAPYGPDAWGLPRSAPSSTGHHLETLAE